MAIILFILNDLLFDQELILLPEILRLSFKINLPAAFPEQEVNRGAQVPERIKRKESKLTMNILIWQYHLLPCRTGIVFSEIWDT